MSVKEVYDAGRAHSVIYKNANHAFDMMRQNETDMQPIERQ